MTHYYPDGDEIKNFFVRCPVPADVCGRVPAPPLPSVHHRSLHGVPASRRPQALPQHAALHL